jgi:hypothetical protein
MAEREFTDEEIADVVHGAHIRLNARLDDPSPEGPWDTLTGDEQDFIIARVRLIRQGASPEQVQEHWVEWMARRGWTPGEEKDYAAKTHPNMKGLWELPSEQQLKVFLAMAIVREME